MPSSENIAESLESLNKLFISFTIVAGSRLLHLQLIIYSAVSSFSSISVLHIADVH